MFDIKHYLNSQRLQVDAALTVNLKKQQLSPHLYQPVRYALLTRGKRVRPILCLAACAAVGGNDASAMPAACALEMIHTYSLIHDDLPALDNDNLRRGKPTCHIKFDEATAILTGDTLLNMAFETLTQASIQAEDISQTALWLKAMYAIAIASGSRGMIEGQMRDLIYEGVKLTQDEIENIHKLKTGALIKAAILSGALLGNATDDQINLLNTYAAHIGLAFQVVDDILNVNGDPQIIGKAVGTDQERQKNTYPALLGLEASKQYARELIDSALQALSDFDNKAEPLRALAYYIIDRKR